MIDLLRPEQVVDEWLRIREDVGKVLNITHERTLHSVLVELVTGRGSLWHLYDPGNAWVITEVIDFGYKRSAELSIAVGKFPFQSIAAFHPEMVAWAQERHCTELRARVRPGWEKFMRTFRKHIILTESIEPVAGH